MAITAGTRLGPYEVLAPLGAGGMGEVWRARDTRLDRSVAIKLLPAEFATNAQLRLRLEREARTISQLNDPHICTLYDVGHENGHDYLVMEYLDGETLADRISRGPLPLAEVIRYGVQIATALERAHAAGIVHRDLKPGNVMLTKSGAKLLDFGLAKNQASGLGPRASVSATEHKPLTAEGSIVGTFQYMSPEQLEGDEADARTDIFALGTILYEMATGRRAFDGKTRTSLIAAIVDRDPPPISSFQPLTPRSFERVVKTCLAKNPADRWQSAHDVRLELQWLSDEEDTQIAPRKRSRLAWSVAAVLALIAIGAIAMLVQSKLSARPETPVRTSILPAEGTTFEFYLEGGPPVLSPDGKKIAYVASTNAQGVGLTPGRTLWIRSLDSSVAQSLSGTEGASQPFWSPDRRYVAFYADGTLKKIEATVGAALPICASDTVRGGSWNRDGTILVGHASGPITRVAASGGTPVEVTELDHADRDTTHRWPWFLPDGKHFLFLAGPHLSDEALDVICVGSTETKMRKPLIHATSSVAYYDGWIIFVRDRVLTAQRFDPEKLELSGDPVALSEQHVEIDTSTGKAFFSIAQDGTLLYQTGSGIRDSQLTWLNRAGKETGKLGEPNRYGAMAISPNARYVAYGTIPRQNIWMFDQARGTTTRLTLSNARDANPIWSPDGTRIAYMSLRSGAKAFDIYVKDLRTGAEKPLVVNDHDKTPSSWSSDGQMLFYTEQTNGPTKVDVMYFSFADGKPHAYLATQFSESAGRISPDRKWVAYQSSETPPMQIYIAPFPPTGAKWQVSISAAGNPHWRGDGQELFYNSATKVVAVPVTLSSTVEIGQQVNLFDIRFGGASSWDVTADGQRFLVNGVASAAPAAAPLTLVQHFDTELRAAAQRHE